MQFTPDRLAVCTVSSYNYLHYTLNLVRSIRRHWSSNPVVYVVLIDGADLPTPGFDALGDIVFVAAEELGIENLTWLRLKHDAGQMCTVVRPFALEHVLARGHREVFYCDSDVYFFADAAPFIAEDKAADFILTPHMFSPMPRDDVWVKSAIGHVTAAGIINNGMFLCRDTAATRKFLRQYGDFMSGPAAALDDLGAVRDQPYFNWIIAFGAKVHLSRNPAMNVAYWNLHERPVRWAKLDGGAEAAWTVDGRPLISFHFSGFDWDRGRLSGHDFRHTVLWNASLHALGEFYRAQLRASFEGHYTAAGYRYASLGDTVLKPGIRLEIKRSARVREPQIADWASSGPRVFRHLNDTLGSYFLLPLYLENIVHTRPDLQTVSGGERIHSPFMHWWTNKALEREYDVGIAWERYADFAVHKGYVEALASSLVPHLTGNTAARIVQRLTSGRRALVDELIARRAPQHAVEKVEAAEYRYAAIIPAQCLRLIYDGWQTLRSHYPDPLGKDFAAFREWLTVDFPHAFDVPPAVAAFVATFDVRKCLARVIGLVRRHAQTAAIFRASGLCKEVLTSAIGLVNYRLGYSADDLIVVDWWLVGRSAAEIAALDVYAPNDIDTRSGRAYLDSWLQRCADGEGDAHADASPLQRPELEAYLAAVGGGEALAFEAIAGKPAPRNIDPNRASVFLVRAAEAARAVGRRIGPGAAQMHPALAPDGKGINLLGYFGSPIGLGVASSGLSKALTTAEFKVRETLLLANVMNPEFTLSDLTIDFAFNYPRTMVVTHPHIDYRQSEVLPDVFMRGRETIGYFAWEQRDFPLQWRPIVDQYDRVCALSNFAAESISRGVGRPVHALPCVVEIHHDIAKAAARKLHNIPVGKFVVGFAFDAGSSTDRKNPMAFAKAVIGAFAGRSDVLVLVKYASATRLEFVERYIAFRDLLARSGLDHRIVTEYIDRAQVEALIAAMDVYVSLHRSEGFGYTLAEAMMLGVPAMATGYSGNLDFMTEANSYLVDYKESVVRRRDGPFEIGSVWAEPDIDDAVDKLKSIYADYGRAQEKARRAKLDVENTVSVAAVAKRLREILG